MNEEQSQAPEVLVEKRDTIGVLTLNRPDRLNAISATMLDEFSRQLIPLFASKQFREGMLSFMEKREPEFEGR
jgi:enoyl-CoA hydratase/carnithine racemase